MAVISKTVKSSGGDYASDGAAEAGIRASADNDAANSVVVNVDAFEQSTNLSIGAGWNVTGLTFQNATGAQHNGTRGTGARIVGSFSGLYCILIGDTVPVTIQGHAAHNTHSTASSFGAALGTGKTANIIDCLSYDAYQSFHSGSGAGVLNLINFLAYKGSYGIRLSSGNLTVYAYNFTLINHAVMGVRVNGVAGSTVIGKNGYSGNNTVDYYLGTGVLTLTNCISSDGTRSTSIVSVANAKFTNSTASSEDCHIASDSGLKDIGTDLHADANYPFNVDFEGDLRPDGVNQWDVGADEYIAAAGGFLNRNYFWGNY